MNEQVIEALEDLEQPAPDGELVHWMPPKRRPTSAGGISTIAAGGFALGVAATVTVLALAHLLGPPRVIVIRQAS
jgi:hypothetical protein